MALSGRRGSLPIESTSVIQTDTIFALSQQAVCMRHLRMLGIKSKRRLREFKTLDDLKEYARKYYKNKMPRLHPDTAKYYKLEGRRPVRQTFLTVHEAYKWLMSLTEENILFDEKKSETVYDCPLPWHLDSFGVVTKINHKSVAMPWGYHEDREWVLYQ